MAKDMLGQVVRKIVDFPLDMVRVICDLIEKLAGEAGQEWLAELKKFLRKEKCWIGIVPEIFLKLISGREDLILDAVGGSEVIVDAKDFVHTDSDFRNWRTDGPGQATPETPVEVYEMVKDGNFVQMFSSLNTNPERLCLTQHQILNFVRKYRNWLRADGYGTFFPFKSYDQFFVANAHVDSDGLRVRVFRFEVSGVWRAGRCHRVVVPQLAQTL